LNYGLADLLLELERRAAEADATVVRLMQPGATFDALAAAERAQGRHGGLREAITAINALLGSSVSLASTEAA